MVTVFYFCRLMISSWLLCYAFDFEFEYIFIYIRVWCYADNAKNVLAILWFRKKKGKKSRQRDKSQILLEKNRLTARIMNFQLIYDLQKKIDSVKIFIFNLILGYLCCDDHRPRASKPFNAHTFLSFRIICQSHEFEMKLSSERDRKIEYMYICRLRILVTRSRSIWTIKWPMNVLSFSTTKCANENN